MTELFSRDLQETGHKSSKGNQLKWESGGIWYKADYTGYEGLSEYVISHLLQMSSLGESEYVIYEPESISYRGAIFHGCRSRNFLEDDWQIITLERLFRNFHNESLSLAIYRIPDRELRLQFIVREVERITGLREFGIYMSKVITIDTLFLNEDRHMHNLSVLVNGAGQFRLCPIFDHGAALLADTTMDYPLGKDTYELMKSASPKTFCTDFEEQLDIAERLYGTNISFRFGKKDVDKLLENASSFGYEKKVTERVRTIIYEQMRTHEYLFT